MTYNEDEAKNVQTHTQCKLPEKFEGQVSRGLYLRGPNTPSEDSPAQEQLKSRPSPRRWTAISPDTRPSTRRRYTTGPAPPLRQQPVSGRVHEV